MRLGISCLPATQTLHSPLFTLHQSHPVCSGPLYGAEALLTRVRYGNDGQACKPNSVPSQRATVIPLARESPPGSSILPGCQAARVTPPSLFELAPCGVCQACPLPGTRCALTAPFHPYPLRGGIFSVALSVPMEKLHEPPGLRGTLPCGVRTFLPPNALASSRRPFDLPDGILARISRQVASETTKD